MCDLDVMGVPSKLSVIRKTDSLVGNAIDSGMGLSITIDKLRVFINKTLSILSVYQKELINRRCLSTVG